MLELKIEKMYDDVIMPKYQQCGDAGFDLHAYLYDEEDNDMLVNIKIHPGASVKIRTGLKFEIPEGYYLQLVPRSSAGIKKDLMLKNTLGIIDSGFRGEVLMFVKNIGSQPIEIINGERLIQGILLECPKVKIVEVDKVSETSRGAGFGSSGVV